MQPTIHVCRSRERSLFEKDDLQTLPLPEVEKRLGSSPDGLSQAETQLG